MTCEVGPSWIGIIQVCSSKYSVLTCEVGPSWRRIIPVCSSKYSVLTCALGPRWEGTMPSCKIIECTVSGYNEFTIPSVSESIVPTTEVSFKCKPGYQLPVGDTGTRTCQKGGTMSASPPACEDINECLSTPCQNGATCHNEVNAYSCTCMPGYQGTNCESEIPCTTPGSVLHASASVSGLAVGQTVTYTCDFGYAHTSGYSVLTCEVGPSWRGIIPVCSMGPSWRGIIPVCSSKYSVLTCEVGPSWRGIILVCSSKYSVLTCEVGPSWIGIIQVCSSKYSVLTCEVGPSWRRIIPVCSSKYSVLTCALGPRWEGTMPSCKIIECTVSGYNEFTIPSVSESIVPTTEVSFKCKPGYQLPVGDTGTRTCQKGGTMSASPPACEDINECLSTPCQNGATCHNEVNAYSCTCMPGYQGTNCESEIPCTTPGSVLHASANVSGLAVGQTVTYTCDFGYAHTSGDSVLICEVGPSWRGIIPVCSSRYSVLTCEVGPSWRGIIPVCSS
ncbi:neurogenic locus notch homolog protein 1-like [Mytilus edulis]|uniref:neurogenic locus notch homolog protein 1-like n=1 Tax=Mytilus edulis TaxID=6550 RepID=UPI0039EE8421